jgi:hypothetical protein
MANTNSQGNQAISPNRKARTASRGGRAPFFLSNELRAASVKLRAELRASSYEQRASSNKRLIKDQSSSAKHGVSRWSDIRPRTAELG